MCIDARIRRKVFRIFCRADRMSLSKCVGLLTPDFLMSNRKTVTEVPGPSSSRIWMNASYEGFDARSATSSLPQRSPVQKSCHRNFIYMTVLKKALPQIHLAASEGSPNTRQPDLFWPARRPSEWQPISCRTKSVGVWSLHHHFGENGRRSPLFIKCIIISIDISSVTC